MDETQLGAGSSEVSLHSNTAAGAAAAACSSSKGKGGHISALRSLGLLHELQEYVAACVETTQQQERELWKLKAEKKEAERALKHKALRLPDSKQPCLQQFQASEVCDLPPRLRALFEDNKVLKEQARRYKQRLQEAERHAAGIEQQLLAAQATSAKLKAQLQEGAAGGQDAQEEAAKARQQADGLSKALEKLQHAHQVLQLKLDTDARLHRQALAAAARDRQQLEQQCQELQEQLEAKDKEARAQALVAKQAKRKLEETKAAAAKAVAGVSAQVAEAVAAIEAKHVKDAEARVHLMLCIIREPAPSSSSSRQHQQQAQQDLLEAPAQGQGDIWDSPDSSSGPSGRNRSASRCCSPGGLSREQAVLRLQAGARGYLARKQQRLQRQLQQESLVLLQIGHRQQPQEEQQEERAAPSEALSSDAAAGAHAASAAGSDPAAACSRDHSLPLELPVLDLTSGGNATWLPNTHVQQQLPTAAAAAGAGACAPAAAAAASGGKAAAAAAGAGTGKSNGNGIGARQRVTGSGHAASRKPPLPSFTRAPPASAPHERAAQQGGSSRPSGTSVRGTRSGPGATTAGAGAAVAGGSASSSCDGARGGDRSGRLAGVAAGQHKQQQQQHQPQADKQRRLSLQPHPPSGQQPQQRQQDGSPRRVSSLQARAPR